MSWVLFLQLIIIITWAGILASMTITSIIEKLHLLKMTKERNG